MFLFSDKIVETHVQDDKSSNMPTQEMANDYFRRCGDKLVLNEEGESIYIDMLYRVEIFYYDDKNDFLMDTIWLKPSYNVADPQVKD